VKKILKKAGAILSVIVNIVSIGAIAIALIIAKKRSVSDESRMVDSLRVKYESDDSLIMVSEPNATSFVFRVKRKNVDCSFYKYHIDRQDVLSLESGALIATFFLKNDSSDLATKKIKLPQEKVKHICLSQVHLFEITSLHVRSLHFHLIFFTKLFPFQKCPLHFDFRFLFFLPDSV